MLLRMFPEENFKARRCDYYGEIEWCSNGKNCGCNGAAENFEQSELEVRCTCGGSGSGGKTESGGRKRGRKGKCGGEKSGGKSEGGGKTEGGGEKGGRKGECGGEKSGGKSEGGGEKGGGKGECGGEKSGGKSEGGGEKGGGKGECGGEKSGGKSEGGGGGKSGGSGSGSNDGSKGGSGGNGKRSNPKSDGGCGKGSPPKKKARTPHTPIPPFCTEKVRKILKNNVLELLDNTYKDILSNSLSQRVVSCVRRQVKEMKFDPRYKYVCFITVAERGEHNLPLVTRTLWNPNTDKCACFCHRTCSTLTTILCFGIIS